ncbi:MAG TPA: ATP-binding protein, partial [Bryobacteraceae bacterium]|nr:ATP-binding protein [Bryobacteraceae bacterium]
DMLTFSRVANMENVPVGRISLDAIVKWARQNLEVAIQESDADIHVSPLGFVSGNQIQMVQLFQNLIANAIKHRIPEVRPRIDIRSERQDGSVTVVVADNGPGIEAQYHDHIFGVFKRLSRNTRGTGIGLAICRRIVEKHHGRIWVESDLGRGAKFFVSLPASPEPAERSN